MYSHLRLVIAASLIAFGSVIAVGVPALFLTVDRPLVARAEISDSPGDPACRQRTWLNLDRNCLSRRDLPWVAGPGRSNAGRLELRSDTASSGIRRWDPACCDATAPGVPAAGTNAPGRHTSGTYTSGTRSPGARTSRTSAAGITDPGVDTPRRSAQGGLAPRSAPRQLSIPTVHASRVDAAGVGASGDGASAAYARGAGATQQRRGARARRAGPAPGR